jgi:hypothetical protein
MRTSMSAGLMSAALAAALAMTAMPAQAAWKNYINNEIGFSFTAPGEVKARVGNSRAQVAGPRQSIVYRSAEDNVEYRVTVVSFMQSQAEGATLLGERQYMFQDKKTVLTDTFARAGSGKDAVYGRKLVIELPDKKGRTTAVFYFTRGKLVTLEATVLPGKGDPASPDATRFIESISFAPSAAGPGAVELETPALD